VKEDYEWKISALVYYNEEITHEERMRRWDSLNQGISYGMVKYLEQFRNIPWPQAWHDGKDQYTQEGRDSAVENFPKARAVMHRIPEICLERRRLAFPVY
jgi:hypothetical protein